MTVLTWTLLIFCTIFAIGTFVLVKQNQKLKKQAEEQVQLNESIIAQNKQNQENANKIAEYLEELKETTARFERQKLEAEKQAFMMQEKINSAQTKVDNLQEVYENTKLNQNKLLEERKNAAEKELEIHKQEIAETYEQFKQDLNTEYLKVSADLAQYSVDQLAAISAQASQLEDLKNKQLAYVREKLRQEEVLAKQDFFRLVLSDEAMQDIALLRDVQRHLTKRESIDKIIWSVYYKPAFDILCSHLFDTKDIKCGIYKITCIDSGQAYIGQSVNIKTRWSDHIKSGLDCGPSTNRLYQAMKKYQPCNFLFEILEEVPREKLNEREKYYIDFYCTQEVGLNVTTGGA